MRARQNLSRAGSGVCDRLSCQCGGPLWPVAHTAYLPRHSACGTLYHRYVLLLFRIEYPTAKLSLRHRPLELDAFDVRKFVKEHGLRTDTGGAFMWRAVWDEESSRIRRDVLSKHTLRI